MATTTEASSSTSTPRKAAAAPEKKYKCQYCNRAFSRSEHRSRHERSRKFVDYFYFVQARDEGQAQRQLPHRAFSRPNLIMARHATTPAINHPHPPSAPLTFIANMLIMQTPRNVLSNAKNVEVPSFVEISCSATTELCMPKMEECPFSLKEEKEQAQPRHRPRTQSPPSTSIRARWSRLRQAVMVCSTLKLPPC